LNIKQYYQEENPAKVSNWQEVELIYFLFLKIKFALEIGKKVVCLQHLKVSS